MRGMRRVRNVREMATPRKCAHPRCRCYDSLDLTAYFAGRVGSCPKVDVGLTREHCCDLGLSQHKDAVSARATWAAHPRQAGPYYAYCASVKDSHPCRTREAPEGQFPGQQATAQRRRKPTSCAEAGTARLGDLLPDGERRRKVVYGSAGIRGAAVLPSQCEQRSA